MSRNYDILYEAINNYVESLRRGDLEQLVYEDLIYHFTVHATEEEIDTFIKENQED
jgi:hypothetical protein